MAIDISALVILQQRRTKRAKDKFAAAENEYRAIVRQKAQLKAFFGETQRRQIRSREEKMINILKAPTTLATIARVRFQYESDLEELNKINQEIFQLEPLLIEAEEKVQIARANLQACTKREKKLDAMAEKLKISALRIEDVQAEMELEG